MKFQILPTDSKAEKKLKEAWNSLFSKEAEELLKLANLYFRIVDEGGIVWYKNFYFADIPNVEEKVEYLIRKKVIGKCERTLDDGVLLYDNFDSRFTPFLNILKALKFIMS